jgi:hypothetical protein
MHMHIKQKTARWYMSSGCSFRSYKVSNHAQQVEVKVKVKRHARDNARAHTSLWTLHHRIHARQWLQTRRACLSRSRPTPPAPRRDCTCLFTACSRTYSDSASAGQALRLWDSVSERDTQLVLPRSKLTPRIPLLFLQKSTEHSHRHGFARPSPH